MKSKLSAANDIFSLCGGPCPTSRGKSSHFVSPETILPSNDIGFEDSNVTSLLRALPVKLGNPSLVEMKILLRENPSFVNLQDFRRFIVQSNDTGISSTFSGSTPLHYASYRNNENIVELLVEKGANINAQRIDGSTPLHNAVVSGNANIVRILLLQPSIDINITDNFSRHCLHFTARFGLEKITDYLLNSGICQVDPRMSGGNTPLHCASLWGHLPIVKRLVDAGADIEARNSIAFQPLHYASSNGHIGVVQYLVEQMLSRNHLSLVTLPMDENRTIVSADTKNKIGIYLDGLRDYFGDSCIDKAHKGSHLDVVRFLFSLGCRLSAFPEISAENEYLSMLEEATSEEAASSASEIIVDALFILTIKGLTQFCRIVDVIPSPPASRRSSLGSNRLKKQHIKAIHVPVPIANSQIDLSHVATIDDELNSHSSNNDKGEADTNFDGYLTPLDLLTLIDNEDHSSMSIATDSEVLDPVNITSQYSEDDQENDDSELLKDPNAIFPIAEGSEDNDDF